jgi:hypothetical protein
MKLTIFENLGIDALWETLGGDAFQLFGRECGSSAIWMVICLFLRELLVLLRLESYCPYGIIFAFPLLIEVSML